MGVYEEEYGKICPYCQEQFNARRINQKYCSSRCKYTSNNRKRKEKELRKLPHQKMLDRNRSILETIYRATKNHAKLYSKKELQDQGFSFQFLTSSARTRSGKGVISVYNYFLCIEKDGFYTINKAA